MKEYYDILGVKHDASEKEIKLVYRKLSKIYHPDMKVTGNEKAFKKISEAYKVIEKNNFVYVAVSRKQEKIFGKSSPINNREYYRGLIHRGIDDFFSSIWRLLVKIWFLIVVLFNYLKKNIPLFLKSKYFKQFLIFIGVLFLLLFLFLLMEKYIERKDREFKQKQREECIIKHGINSLLEKDEEWEQVFSDSCYCRKDFYAEEEKCLAYEETKKGMESVRLKEEAKQKKEEQILLQKEIVVDLFDMSKNENFEGVALLFSGTYKSKESYDRDYPAYKGIVTYAIEDIECAVGSCAVDVNIEEVNENNENVFNKYYFEYSFVLEDEILKIDSSKIKFISREST